MCVLKNHTLKFFWANPVPIEHPFKFLGMKWWVKNLLEILDRRRAERLVFFCELRYVFGQAIFIHKKMTNAAKCHTFCGNLVKTSDFRKKWGFDCPIFLFLKVITLFCVHIFHQISTANRPKWKYFKQAQRTRRRMWAVFICDLFIGVIDLIFKRISFKGAFLVAIHLGATLVSILLGATCIEEIGVFLTLIFKTLLKITQVPSLV